MTNKTTLQLLPLIQPAQAQKHVTVNAAMMALDVLVQTSVTSRVQTAPPFSAVAGDSYIVADGATGDWLSEDHAVAVYSGVFWDLYTPKTGWRVWVEDEQTEAVFDGAEWTTSADRPELVAALGISATPDDTNRLTVSSDATLFTNAGAGHQLKINKATTGDTASLLFQTGYSGRAEMGNVGGNDFAVKVSPDGTTFLTGLLIESSTGRVLAPHGINVAVDAGDPVTPQNGDIWYNASSGKLRGRQAGVNVDLYQVVSSQITDSTAAGRALLTAPSAAVQVAALGAETTANKGAINGYAGLDGAGKVPASQLPSYVDSVQEYANLAAFPTTGTTGKIYVTLDTNKTYRWSGTVYVQIANSTTDWGGLTGKPTSVAGFGIVDAVDLTSAQSVSGAKTFTGAVTFGGAITATDAQFTLKDDADPTKLAKFDLSTLTAGTSRTLALPDADGTLALNTVFAPVSDGLVPASGGGSTNFLRADGTWASPPVGSGGGGSYASLSGIPPALDALDALTPTANSLAYFTAPSVAALTALSTTGRTLIGSATASAARTTLEVQDFVTRASFVGWAAGRVPATGMVIKAAGYAYRYIGSGTAISDLPGWVPNDVVTAMHWNADNTGVVSAIGAVSAMLDYLNANGGGTAFLPAGTYRWAGQMIKQGLNRITLQGEGNATKIARSGNQAGAAIKFWGGANNRIRSILIDCAGYSGIGFFLGDQYSGIEDCECNNSPSRPFQMIGGGNTTYGLDSLGRTSDDVGFTTPTFFPIGCYYDNCRTNRAGATAFSQKQMAHSRIQRCVAQNVWSEGITIDRCDYSVVSGNTLLNVGMSSITQFPDLDAGTGYLIAGGGGVGGIGIDGSVGARCIKNTIIGVQTNVTVLNNRKLPGICFVNNIRATTGCEVEGNYISDAKSGVWLKGTGSGAAGNNFANVISGNVFDTMGTAAGTGSAQYGAIWIDAGNTGNAVTGNTQAGGVPLITGVSSANSVDQMAAGALKGNNTGGVGLGLDLSGTQATAMLDTFTSSTKGLTPASGGGAANFLRADGIWATPAGGGGGSVTDGDKGDVIVSGSGTVWALDYPAVNATVAPVWGAITAKPTTVAGYGITDAATLTGTQTLSAKSVSFATNTVTTTKAQLNTAVTDGDVVFVGDTIGWASLAATPTTIAGYGITDAATLTGTQTLSAKSVSFATNTVTTTKAQLNTAVTDGDVVFVGDTIGWASLTATPTTIAGYGITDGVTLAGTQTVSGAKTFAAPLVLSGQATDPASPANGAIWYNSTTSQLKAQSGGTALIIDSAQNLGWLTPVSGDYMLTTIGAGAATGGVVGAAGRIDMFPFTARADTPVTGLAVNVTTLLAGALGKIAVYDSDATGRPNNLLTETADLDFSIAGVRTATVALTLRQGKTYWFAVRHSSTATLSTWAGTATPDINGGAPATTARKSVRRTLTYATAATSPWGWSAAEINAAAPVAVWLKV
jgi:hypothetical protein